MNQPSVFLEAKSSSLNNLKFKLHHLLASWSNCNYLKWQTWQSTPKEQNPPIYSDRTCNFIRSLFYEAILSCGLGSLILVCSKVLSANPVVRPSERILSSLFSAVFSCFQQRLITRAYLSMLIGVMVVYRCLIEVQGASARRKKKA